MEVNIEKKKRRLLNSAEMVINVKRISITARK